MEQVELKHFNHHPKSAPIIKNNYHHFDYSFMVSRTMIGENIWNKTVLDLTPHLNHQLQSWLRDGRANYIHFNLEEIIEENLLGISCWPSLVDITHSRFSLMQLTPQQRVKTIQQAISNTTNKVIFIECDWSSFKGGATINRLRDLAIEIMSKKYDLFFGSNLFNEVSGIAPGHVHEIHEQKFNLPIGRYYNFLSPIIHVLQSISFDLTKNQQKELLEVVQLINLEASKPDPESFSPPDIYAVEVRI